MEHPPVLRSSSRALLRGVAQEGSSTVLPYLRNPLNTRIPGGFTPTGDPCMYGGLRSFPAGFSAIKTMAFVLRGLTPRRSLLDQGICVSRACNVPRDWSTSRQERTPSGHPPDTCGAGVGSVNRGYHSDSPGSQLQAQRPERKPPMTAPWLSSRLHCSN